jgi:hypothetical protein
MEREGGWCRNQSLEVLYGIRCGWLPYLDRGWDGQLRSRWSVRT